MFANFNFLKWRFFVKVAIVTGISGQDGAYLVEVLLRKNDKVFGTYRRSSSVNFIWNWLSLI